MGGACSTHGRYENLKGSDDAEDGVDGMITLEQILGH
jgi:hypothetical protein